MSGRVQKESADDSDRVDDAVDPRVQVSATAAARVFVARMVSPPPPSSSRLAILTLSSSARRGLAIAIKSWKKPRRATCSNNEFHRGFRTLVPFSLANVSYFCPLPPPARPRTHTRTNHKMSPIP